MALRGLCSSCRKCARASSCSGLRRRPNPGLCRPSRPPNPDASPPLGYSHGKSRVRSGTGNVASERTTPPASTRWSSSLLQASPAENIQPGLPGRIYVTDRSLAGIDKCRYRKPLKQADEIRLNLIYHLDSPPHAEDNFEQHVTKPGSNVPIYCMYRKPSTIARFWQPLCMAMARTPGTCCGSPLPHWGGSTLSLLTSAQSALLYSARRRRPGGLQLGHPPALARPQSTCITGWSKQVLERMRERFALGPDRTLLFGFSQPVGLNYRFVATYPGWVRGVVAICGGVPRDWEESHYQPMDAAILHISRDAGRVLSCAGRQDSRTVCGPVPPT